MAKPNNKALADARARIDIADNAILDLLAERAAAVASVRAAKAAEPESSPEFLTALRPAREAQIMNRLLDKADALTVPASMVISLWREIIAAGAQAQIPYEIFILESEKTGEGAKTFARNHFGAHSPISAVKNFSMLMDQMQNASCAVGVVDLIATGHWLDLYAMGPTAPKVFVCLPIGIENPSAMAFSHIPLEPSGNDTTLIVIETSLELRIEGFDLLSQKNELSLVAVDGFHAGPTWSELQHKISDYAGKEIGTALLGIIANTTKG